MPDTTAPMMTPARARPAPVSYSGRSIDATDRRDPNPESRIHNRQTSTTAAIPRISATAARETVASGAGSIGASMTAAGPGRATPKVMRSPKNGACS
jgi:hypothetical protein